MSNDITPPVAHPSITLETVTALIAEQLPDHTHLELGERFDGWDCAMFRLGDALAVRLPRTQDAVRFLQAEMHWVPQLSGGWDFPAPTFVAHGLPSHGYPWPWAVVTWVPGDTADAVPLDADAGTSVGRALAQVHTPAPDDAPFNVEQSIPMADRDVKVRERVARLAATIGPAGERIDTEAAAAIWTEALAASEHAEWVWSHADLHGANVLSHGGAFGGIVDWGSMAMCDPAVDLGFAYTLMPREGVDDAVAEYGRLTGRVDANLLARMRGIALSKCVGVALSPRPVTTAMGWRGLVALGAARAA
ncbi:phosphotransferase [Demequina sp. TTPB684]|uniref:phosphotransferase n=1 Tax=unclassified Demequina TaxID=2620311 RepID=UPI001CF4C6D0|nr:MULTISPECIES: phosphotransferase [unclassified Demequina]MCB2412306.1 phosphotransferase [Demequina sp. TTPB684]UPU87586.1 phosphotransferase [Demequina sp. TMPB413]